jgi:hypothetical protein
LRLTYISALRPAGLGQLLERIARQLEIRGCEILLKVRNRRSAGDHEDVGRSAEQLSGPFLYYPGRRLVPAPLAAFVDFIKALPK